MKPGHANLADATKMTVPGSLMGCSITKPNAALSVAIPRPFTGATPVRYRAVAIRRRSANTSPLSAVISTTKATVIPPPLVWSAAISLPSG
jgi:hypothetical protein